MIWIVVISTALVLVAVGVWFLLRDASPQPPGQHRRPRRRDPHDPIRENHEEPPEQDQP
jgi:hypothetical protein